MTSKVKLIVSLILWSVVVVGISIAALFLKAVVGASSWTHTLLQGDVLLVGLGLTASAIAYTAMTTLDGNINVLKVLVIASGVLFLMGNAIVYAAVSDNANASKISRGTTELLSYVFLGVSLVLGFAATWLTHTSDVQEKSVL